MPPVLPVKHYRWFKIANSHPSNDWKRHWWFPFKEKFLAKFAERDGYDVQLFECYGCNGDPDGCDRCTDGIYRRVYLERWIFPTGEVYHKPSTFLCIAGETPKLEFRGLIKHAPTSANAATRATLRLFLTYQPQQFIPLLGSVFEDARTAIVLHTPILKFRYYLLSRWQKLYFNRRHENEVPF